MLVTFVRFVFMLMLAIGGYKIVDFFRDELQRPKSLWITAIILSIFIGSGVGYVLGGIVGRRLTKILNKFEGYIQKVPGTDLIIAMLGLLLGLFFAFLLFLPLRAIPYVGVYLAILTFIIFGYLGLRLTLRKKEELGRVFNSFSHLSLKASPSLQSVYPSEKILDTSVIIDGRIIDISRTGFIEGRLIVPRFILQELQSVADSEDVLKRNRGRRGLDVLNALQREPRTEIHILEQDYPEPLDVDAKLVRLAKETGFKVFTNDYNLNKVAELQGVSVLNINELANALKPVVLPGEEMEIRIIREGKELGQGVGYLDDGTMIVVDGGKNYVGGDVEVIVTSVLQTPAGRMIFAKLKNLEANSSRIVS